MATEAMRQRTSGAGPSTRSGGGEPFSISRGSGGELGCLMSPPDPIIVCVFVSVSLIVANGSRLR
jgi:hypothetical protein